MVIPDPIRLKRICGRYGQCRIGVDSRKRRTRRACRGWSHTVTVAPATGCPEGPKTMSSFRDPCAFACGASDLPDFLYQG